MNASKIFHLAQSFFNVANDAHLRAIAKGSTSTAPTNGVTIFATMFYGDGPRRYSIKGYRFPGEKQTDLSMDKWISIAPKELDEAAKAAGYYLTNLPEGHIHRLIYRQIEDPTMPPVGYTTEKNQMTSTYNKRAREAAIMAAGNAPDADDKIRIVNVKGMVPNRTGIHYCGRKSGGWRPGVLANPHVMVTEDDRQKVIDMFRVDLEKDIAEQGAMYKQLRQIQARVEEGYNVTLGCWCAPQACHCDVVKEKVIWLMTAQPNAPRLHSTAQANATEPTVRRPNPANVLAAGAPAPSAPPPEDNEPEPEPTAPTSKRFNLVVAIGGDLADYGIVSGALDAALVKMTAASTTLLLHAPAVNIHLDRWTAAHGNMPVTMHKADWINGGVTAQADRDEKMLSQVNGLLVIWNGEETRIADLVKLATDKKLPVRDIRYGKPTPTPTPAPVAAAAPAPNTQEGFNGVYAFLSNFHPAEVMLDGVLYPTTEHAYQAAKTLDPQQREAIRNAATPGQAKRIGGRGGNITFRPDWDSVKDGIMMDLLQQKFSDPEMMIKLRHAAMKKGVVEYNNWHDNYWGHCTCAQCASKTHQNKLGKMLTQIAAPVAPAPVATPDPNNVYRLIVAGGRDFKDYDLLARTLDESAAKLASKGKTLMVVCGMAKGADLLGKEWADNNHLPVDKHPADWNTHGRVAGYRRNEEMAQVADGAIVFWDGISRGSKHMIETAEKKNLPVKIVKYAPAPVNMEAPPEIMGADEYNQEVEPT